MRTWFIGVAATVLLGGGCGAVEESPNLAEAVANTEAAESSRFEVHGVSAEPPVRFECAGTADYARERAAWTCTWGEGGELRSRAVDGKLYVTGGALGENWHVSPDDEESRVSDFSPQRLLSMLRPASSETVRLGQEDVRGVSADHYRLMVDCEEVGMHICSSDTAPVEVWIDGDDLVRRMGVKEEGDSATIEFFDFGVPVDIQPPTVDQSEGSYVREEPRLCDPDGGAPIRASQALDALRRAGFSVKSDRNACFGAVVAAIDNTPVDRVLEREGVVMCHLYDEPHGSITGTVVRRGVDGGDAELVLANLECLLFTDRPDPQPAIERLEQAFRELER